MKRNNAKAGLSFLFGLFMLGGVAVVTASAQDAGVDIDAFEEITPDIRVIDDDGPVRRDFEDIDAQAIELDPVEMEFEEYRPEAPEPAPRPEPPVMAEEPVVDPEPIPEPREPAPIVEAPIEAPRVVAEPTPPPAPADPVAAPAAPVVRMQESGPALPEAAPQPLIPVEPPPERERLRVPSELQLAEEYQPRTLDFTADDRYDQDLQDLQRQLALLRERVIETKSRIVTYGERVARGYTSGTRVVMQSENALGKRVKIESITYYLDGHQVYSKTFDGEEPPEEFTVYRGSILPGKHKVDMEVVLRAKNGLFDFSHSARLKLTTSEYVTANEGKQLNLRVRLFDKGGLFTKADDRPGISFEAIEEDAY